MKQTVHRFLAITCVVLGGEEIALASEMPPRAALSVFDYDIDAPLDVEEIEVTDFPGGTQTELTFASPDGGRVPATLFTPDSEGPHAGMVLMHGMPGDHKSLEESGRRWASAGAVSIAISAPWAREGRDVTSEGYSPSDAEDQIQLIKDLRRAIDLLVEDPAVDLDRMAYFGGSYGAAMGGLLAGVEDRLCAYVLVVGDGGLVAHATEPGQDSLSKLGPKERDAWLAAMLPIEPIRFVGDAAPAELLFQNGTRDQFVAREDAQAFMDAGSEPKTTKWYDSGHGIDMPMIDDHLAWLEERIGIDADGFLSPLLGQ